MENNNNIRESVSKAWDVIKDDRDDDTANNNNITRDYQPTSKRVRIASARKVEIRFDRVQIPIASDVVAKLLHPANFVSGVELHLIDSNGKSTILEGVPDWKLFEFMTQYYEKEYHHVLKTYEGLQAKSGVNTKRVNALYQDKDYDDDDDDDEDGRYKTKRGTVAQQDNSQMLDGYEVVLNDMFQEIESLDQAAKILKEK